MRETTGFIFGMWIGAIISIICFICLDDGITTKENLVETGHGEYNKTTGKFQLKEIKK